MRKKNRSSYKPIYKPSIYAGIPMGEEVCMISAKTAEDLIRQVEQMITDGEILEEYLENPQDEVRGYPVGTKPRFIIL